MTPAEPSDREARSACCECAAPENAPSAPEADLRADAAPAKAPCCCQPKPYKYGPTPWVTGTVPGGAGPVARAATTLTPRDHLGALRVRWGVGRSHFRVPPGLYAVGAPTAHSPVLVTANYKLTFDALRRELSSVDAWILVLDTRGVNVWCAAGKGTFSTAEVVKRVKEAQLDQVVSHHKLILPQLGATGVAKHLVRKECGFTVTYGPVRATDLPAFLAAGSKATAPMRAVRFGLWERLKLIPVEASVIWKWKTLVAVLLLAFLAGLGGDHAFSATQWGIRVAIVYGLVLVPCLAGSVLVPAALPVLPGRAFSTKGALVGAVLAAGTVAGLCRTVPPLTLAALFLGITALSSYWAMTFTGSSTFTSPSGVEKEMRRAIPPQLVGGALAALLLVAEFVLHLVGIWL